MTRPAPGMVDVAALGDLTRRRVRKPRLPLRQMLPAIALILIAIAVAVAAMFSA